MTKSVTGRIPESKFLLPDADRIKEEVCKVFGVDQAEMYESRKRFSNQPGNVGTYLLGKEIICFATAREFVYTPGFKK